jgi:tetratricopeptide (TPR) repeat protein
MRIAARDPENPAAARLLASMEWSSGRQGEALARLREASEAHPCDVKLVKYDAALRRSAGDVQGALDVVDGCLECNGPLVELLYQQAASYIELGDYPSTHGAVRGMRAVATNPSSLALVAATEGDLAAAQGHWLRAKGHYLESLRLRPDRVHVRLALGKVYRELDRDRDALEQFERVRQQTSAYPFLDDWIRDLEAALAAEEAEASDG